MVYCLQKEHSQPFRLLLRAGPQTAHKLSMGCIHVVHEDCLQPGTEDRMQIFKVTAWEVPKQYFRKLVVQMAPCQGGKTLDCVLFVWNCKWFLDFLLALALFKEHFLHCMLSPVGDYSPVQCFQCSWASSIDMARSSSASCKLHTYSVLPSVSPCHICMKNSVYGYIKERI